MAGTDNCSDWLAGVTGAKHRFRAGKECVTGVNTHELFDAAMVGDCAGVKFGKQFEAGYFDNEG